MAQPVDRHVKALSLLKRRHGHLVLSGLALSMPSELRKWAWKQRERWRLGTLDAALERQLRAIGFPLEVEACEWELTFSRVLALRKQADVLPRLQTEWGQWLEQQRELHRRRGLVADREKRLNRLGAFES